MLKFVTATSLVVLVCTLVMSSSHLARADEADDTKTQYAKKMTASAKAHWDELHKDMKTEEGFDPNSPEAFKGKLIVVETDNLMGYRFNPGDFPFATTIDGNPVAGKFDATVAKAIKAVQAKLGRDLGDNDDDGKWTIIARVEGSKGKLSKRVKTEATVDGSTVSVEKAESVDAPIITILAAHCGPLAAAKDKGMAMEDGTVGQP